MGHKWSLAAVYRALDDLGHDTAALRRRIDVLLAKTLIAAQNHVSLKYNSIFRRRGACFELFGFDVMLDEQLRPWLIEVNVSPDLASTSPLDRQLKGGLATDVLHLVGIQPPPPVAAAAGLPIPPPPKHDEPPVYSRQRGSGHLPAELDGVPFSRLSRTELALLVDAQEEWSRAAHTQFRRIYPSPIDATQTRLLRLFESLRVPDALLSSYARRADAHAELQAALDDSPALTEEAGGGGGAAATRRPSSANQPPVVALNPAAISASSRPATAGKHSGRSAAGRPRASSARPSSAPGKHRTAPTLGATAAGGRAVRAASPLGAKGSSGKGKSGGRRRVPTGGSPARRPSPASHHVRSLARPSGGPLRVSKAKLSEMPLGMTRDDRAVFNSAVAAGIAAANLVIDSHRMRDAQMLGDAPTIPSPGGSSRSPLEAWGPIRRRPPPFGGGL